MPPKALVGVGWGGPQYIAFAANAWEAKEYCVVLELEPLKLQEPAD